MKESWSSTWMTSSSSGPNQGGTPCKHSMGPGHPPQTADLPQGEKCTFGQPMVEFLGLILLEGRIEMDPVKVAHVHNWLIPRNITEVKSFIRFVNFYQQFIQDFLHMAKLLHQLTKKG